ncbi:MAG: hypothetical protein U0269_32310 [Polyangiales bacterium]
MSDSGRDFVLVAEDTAAAIAAATIVDRVIHERGEQWQRDLWDDEQRATHRRWRSLRTDSHARAIDGVGTFSTKQNVAPDRKITLAPGRGGVAVEVAKFFAALDEADERATLAVFACDLDGQERSSALSEHDERVQRAKKNGNARADCFVIALAQPEFEAWFIAGFTAQTTDEQRRLEEQRRACGFDPCANPEQLHSNSNGPRDAKNVLEALCASRKVADERVRACVERCPLDVLETRGEAAGVRRFTEQITRELLPAL